MVFLHVGALAVPYIPDKAQELVVAAMLASLLLYGLLLPLLLLLWDNLLMGLLQLYIVIVNWEIRFPHNL